MTTKSTDSNGSELLDVIPIMPPQGFFGSLGEVCFGSERNVSDKDGLRQNILAGIVHVRETMHVGVGLLYDNNVTLWGENGRSPTRKRTFRERIGQNFKQGHSGGTRRHWTENGS